MQSNRSQEAIAKLSLCESGHARLTANRSNHDRKKYDTAIKDMAGWLQKIGHVVLSGPCFRATTRPDAHLRK